ncbi:hypothetical protein Vafri_14571, partial [Volvox africanus]
LEASSLKLGGSARRHAVQSADSGPCPDAACRCAESATCPSHSLSTSSPPSCFPPCDVVLVSVSVSVASVSVVTSSSSATGPEPSAAVATLAGAAARARIASFLVVAAVFLAAGGECGLPHVAVPVAMVTAAG